MKKLLYIFFAVFMFTSCDDGDIITEELDFEDTFQSCGELVFYKVKESPAESLSLKITSPSTTLEELLEVDENGVLETTLATFTINGSTNQFNYRRYNITPNNFFCNDVPSSDIIITSDEESTTGMATIKISLLEDDEDGIPAEMEDLNSNGDLTDDDTDGDGLPNYLDEDDDGDNVLTRLEIDTENLDGDDNPLTNPTDTDNDGTPNYLDTNDDNDAILTIDEDANEDLDPSNDFTTSGIADYLNSSIENEETPATAYRNHNIQQDFTLILELTSIVLPSITYDMLPFGILEDSRLNNVRIVEIPF